MEKICPSSTPPVELEPAGQFRKALGLMLKYQTFFFATVFVAGCGTRPQTHIASLDQAKAKYEVLDYAEKRSERNVIIGGGAIKVSFRAGVSDQEVKFFLSQMSQEKGFRLLTPEERAPGAWEGGATCDRSAPGGPRHMFSKIFWRKGELLDLLAVYPRNEDIGDKIDGAIKKIQGTIQEVK